MNAGQPPIGGARDLGPQRIALTNVEVVPMAQLSVCDNGVADMRGEFTLALVDVMRSKRYLVPYERRHLQQFINDVQQLLDNTADNGVEGDTQHG